MSMQRQFTLHPSRRLAAMLIAAHACAIAALFLPPLPALARGALTIAILFSLIFHLRRQAWLTAPSAIIALTLEGNSMVATTSAGQRLPVRILRDSMVTPYLTVLNMAPQGARFALNVLILPDSLDTESFRQLRVWLRWGAQPE